MNTYLYIAVMALTTYAIRVLPPDAHPKAHQKHVPALVFILRPLRNARRYDLPCHFRGHRLPHDRRPRNAGRHCKRMAGDGTSAGFASLLRNRPRTAISHLICCIDTRRPPEKMPAAFVFCSYSDSLRFLPLTAFPRYGGLGRIRLYRVGTCRSVSTKCGNSSNKFD